MEMEMEDMDSTRVPPYRAWQLARKTRTDVELYSSGCATGTS